ncbi:MAG: YncE family protein [Verrucomicrobia bacterium]|nr:YncE family protein [Verrucomicrobiota bacterium]MBS0636852.1 YncE family protein [Verrucomicrobiota bacterium]
MNRVFFTLCMLLSTYANAGHRNSVVATMTTGVNPDALAITPNGHYAYVVNNNNYGIANQDSVSVLDLRKNVVKTIIYDSSFVEPFRVAISPDGKKAYVANSDGTTLSIIDTKSNEVTGTIGGFDGPSGVAITPDGKYAYVNNYGGSQGVGSGNGNTVSVVDLRTHAIVEVITVDKAPAALAMSSNSNYVYSINYVDGTEGSGTLSIIKTDTNSVVNTVSGFFGPFGIALTPNCKYAYITNFGSNDFAPFGNTVSVVRLGNDPRIVATIDVSIQPSGIAISPNGRYAYVTNYNTLYAGSNFTKLTPGAGTVNIIDIKKNRVIAPTIEVGHSPNTVTISPDGKFAYVTNYTSGTVDVILLKE